MTTIKTYTDIEQSKKLAEILPLESADMWWLYVTSQGKRIAMMYEEPDPHYLARMEGYGIKDAAIRCWSLAALLNVLPNGTDVVKEETDTENERYMCTVGVKNDIISTFANNPVDACFGMILKLHEIRMKKVKESQETNTVHGNGDNREKINSYPQRYMRDSWYND